MPAAKAAAPELVVNNGKGYLPWASVRGVGQAFVHRSDARYRVVMAGRQSGKTICGIAEVCMDAMEHPGHINWWVCPNYSVKPRAVRGIDEFLPPSAVTHKSGTEHPRFELKNGSIIYITSADAEGSLVSESLDFAVCDEAGQWKESAFDRGIRPMFLARPHARALLIGTPRGKNWFHMAWLRGWDKAGCMVCRTAPGKCGTHSDGWESFHWKSEDSPYISKKELEDARNETSLENFLQEYEADPLDNASAVFRKVRDAVRMATAVPDQLMVVGADLARTLDFSALVAMNGSRQVTSVEEWQTEWSETERRIIARAFGLNARVVMDATGVGDRVVEAVRNAGVQVEGYVFSNQTKYNLIQNLKIALEQGNVSIPSHVRLIEQLEAYEYVYDEDKRKFFYGAPEGQHDDLVIALALAVWGQRGAFVRAAVATQPSTYMGRGGASSYLSSTRGGSKWPL